MLQFKKSFWRSIKEYVIITIGLLSYVLGWTLFLVPNNLIGGGVTGIASIVQYATGIKIGYTYFVVNVGLLIAALFVLGKGFGGKTVYAIILASLGLNVMQAVIPEDIVTILATDNGKLMSTIMGGILAGVGMGMTMSQGGSTGGTDIIALIVNKYRNVSPGRMILFMDVAIILSSMLVPSYTSDGSLMPWADKITTVVYGFILVVIVIFVVTQLIDNFLSQPIIYSTSIKATPLEIFIVLLIAGHISGPLGMIVAIPSYTVVRVIAFRFFPEVKAIRRLRENKD